ncbi:hypothetical protein A3F37_01445 [Candidatus Saccharibacteria bacterium RIFCSPHIGHO2_12_FULL_41_12]|nr:MAG: hypothetical protein A3F37_01445 [Candidatus Saccharibacteria bacterium RIFCSPHIGHO2_12_FULL_41_12]
MATKYFEAVGHVQDSTSPNVELNKHLGFLTLGRLEGFCIPEQATWLQRYLQDPKHSEIKEIAEIGFNSGHSANAFLSARKDIKVTSFEKSKRRHVNKGKSYIDEAYPGRHELITGESLITLPVAVHRDNLSFDMLFIDGSHRFANAYGDLMNGKQIVRKGGIAIMDDILPHKLWGRGPAKAWETVIESGLIQELEVVTAGPRTWAVGQYINK